MQSLHTENVMFVVVFLSLLFATGCSITTSFQKKAIFTSNGIATIGYRFSLEKPFNGTPSLKSIFHLGVPIWIDMTGQVQSCISVSPVVMTDEYLYGVQIAPFSGIGKGKGLQCALVGLTVSMDGLLLAPVSFVERGHCVQVGLWTICSIGRGSVPPTSGQIALVNFAGRSPHFQIGLYNNAGYQFFQDDLHYGFSQFGFWNIAEMHCDSVQPGRRGRDGDRDDSGNPKNVLRSSQCGFINVIYDSQISSERKGVGNQYGLLNLAYGISGSEAGFQCGIVNLSDDDNGMVQIGLFNKKDDRWCLFFLK